MERTESLDPGNLDWSHLELAYAYLLSLHLVFFGTGNLASISSFTLEAVYRLMTQFNPFAMAALLILKLLLPFALLSASLGIIAHQHARLPPIIICLLVAASGDLQTIAFFYQVRSIGSWLEIGTSISHFVIGSVLMLVTVLMFMLSEVLLHGVKYTQVKSKEK